MIDNRSHFFDIQTSSKTLNSISSRFIIILAQFFDNKIFWGAVFGEGKGKKRKTKKKKEKERKKRKKKKKKRKKKKDEREEEKKKKRIKKKPKMRGGIRDLMFLKPRGRRNTSSAWLGGSGGF